MIWAESGFRLFLKKFFNVFKSVELNWFSFVFHRFLDPIFFLPSLLICWILPRVVSSLDVLLATRLGLGIRSKSITSSHSCTTQCDQKFLVPMSTISSKRRAMFSYTDVSLSLSLSCQKILSDCCFESNPWTITVRQSLLPEIAIKLICNVWSQYLNIVHLSKNVRCRFPFIIGCAHFLLLTVG